jgi:putative protease
MPAQTDGENVAVKSIRSLPVYRAKKKSLYGFFETAEQASLCEGIDKIFLPPEECLKMPLGFASGVRLPFLLYDDALPAFEQLLERVRQHGVQYAEVNNLGQIALSLRHGFLPVGGIGLNLYNSPSVTEAARLGLVEATFSAECSFPQMRDMHSILPTGIFAYGRLPLMHTTHCVVKNNFNCGGNCRLPQTLTDRTGAAFLVKKAPFCANTLYNGVPLWLADKKKELRALSLSFLSLYFIDETPKQAKKITSDYLAKEEISPPEHFTRGLYTRGVL